MTTDLRSAGVVIYTTSSCPYCNKAKAELTKSGATFKEVQVDKDPSGVSIRADLKKRTGRTSVPSVWIKGQFVGGLNDGGPAGGVAGLAKAEMLVPMLKKAGAVKKGALDKTPLAPLMGNNLRDALGSIGGATGQMRDDKRKR